MVNIFNGTIIVFYSFAPALKSFYFMFQVRSQSGCPHHVSLICFLEKGLGVLVIIIADSIISINAVTIIIKVFFILFFLFKFVAFKNILLYL